MKSQVKKIDACTREVDIEVGQDQVANKLSEIYGQIGKTAKIPGFRPGSVPREILEKHHSKLAEEELIKVLVPDAYQKSLDEHGIITYAPPDISGVSLKDNILKFKAKVETKPEMDLKNYKSIKINKKTPEVKEVDIDKQLQELVKEREREGDLSDNFAKSLGYKDLEGLKDTLRKQAFLHAQEESYNDALNQLIEQLLKDNPISAPAGLVKQQLERRLQELRYRVRMHGHEQAETEEEIKKLTPSLEKDCERDIKVFLLLEEIAKKEDIKVKDHSKLGQRAIEFLLEHAQWQ